MPSSATTAPVAAAAAPPTPAVAAAAPAAVRCCSPIPSAIQVSNWIALITTIPAAVARAREIPPTLPSGAGNILHPRLLPRLQPARSRIIGLAKAACVAIPGERAGAAGGEAA